MATGSIRKVSNDSASGYCKMPDGTLICWGTITATVSGDWSPWGNGSWAQIDVRSWNNANFAYPFISAPSIVASCGSETWFVTVFVCATNSKISGIVCARPNTITGTLTAQYVAIGRWK